MRILAATLTVASTLILAGCGAGSCDRPEPYMSSRASAPLRVPDGLSVPDGHGVQRVPDVGAGAPTRIGGCLDRPPSVVAAQPRAGQPSAATTPAGSARTAGTGSTADDGSPEAAIEAMVRGWARAWSDGDGDAVTAFYAADFAPGSGVAASEWLGERRAAVDGSAVDRVEVEALEVSDLDGEAGTVRFVQHIVTGGNATALVMEMAVVRDDGRWRIARETVLDVL